MKPSFNLLIAAIMFTNSGLALSGSVSATVSFVQVNSDNRAYIRFNAAPTSSPACATDPRMTVDLTTYSGRAMHNMSLTAKASGRTLYAAGTGTCHSRYEKVNYMRLM